MFGVCVFLADGMHDVFLLEHAFVAQACSVGRN